MSTINLGYVKWFNNAKGYGFIIADNLSEDMFAHYSAIMMEGYKTLKAGQRVSFEIVEGSKGYHAIDIRPLEESEISSPPTAVLSTATPRANAEPELENQAAATHYLENVTA